MNVKKFFLIGLASLGMLVSCDKEDDLMPENSTKVVQDSKNKSYFTLHIFSSSDEYDDDELMRFYFTFTDFSEIPLLIVNGDTVFEVTTTYFTGEYPLTGQVDFSVSAGGRTTTGSIEIPQNPSVSCNGVSLMSMGGWYSENPDTLPVSDNYLFTWDDVQADYYSFDCEEDLYYYSIFSMMNFLRGTSTVQALEPNVNYNLYLTAHNGVLIKSGAKPNVTGAYGDGYVIASSYTGAHELIVFEDTDETFDFKSSKVSQKQKVVLHQPYTIEEVLRIVNQ